MKVIVAIQHSDDDSNVLSGESSNVNMLRPQALAVRAGRLPAQGNDMYLFFEPLADSTGMEVR